jgi:hypothetical protein
MTYLRITLLTFGAISLFNSVLLAREVTIACPTAFTVTPFTATEYHQGQFVWRITPIGKPEQQWNSITVSTNTNKKPEQDDITRNGGLMHQARFRCVYVVSGAYGGGVSSLSNLAVANCSRVPPNDSFTWRCDTP